MTATVTLDGVERLGCFGAYDVRGRAGRRLTEDIARRIGRSVAMVLAARVVVIGRDCRLSGPALSAALTEGLLSEGVSVIDIGVAGTEEVYFAVMHCGACAGIAVTASHNPADENGMKIVGAACRPLSPEDFARISDLAARPWRSASVRGRGRVSSKAIRDLYARALVAQTDIDALRPMRIVANAGHGVAGAALDAIAACLAEAGVTLDLQRLNHRPDGRFPKGVPNPLLPERRGETAEAVKAAGADLGIAWDGDFDRCFLFDHTGAFVDGAHLSAVLAADALSGDPMATVLHDARVAWPMIETARRAGGQAVMARTGHVHMKRAMRETGAIYGGEISGHHYFRSFMACDSGMLPWLKVLARLGREKASLCELVADVASAHPVSGEINYAAPSPGAALDAVERHFGIEASTDRFDGLTLTAAAWRANLRASSTEPLLRLNIETRGDGALLASLREEVDRVLRSVAGCARRM